MDGVQARNFLEFGEEVIPAESLHENVRRIAHIAHRGEQVLHRIADSTPAVRIVVFRVHDCRRLRKRGERSRYHGAIWKRHCSIACYCWICIDVLPFPITSVGR